MTSTSTAEEGGSPLTFSELGGQRDSLAAISDDGALSSNASTIPITDRSNSSPSTETPLLSMPGGIPEASSLPSSSSSCSMSTTHTTNHLQPSRSVSRRLPEAPPALPPRPPNLPIPEEASLPPHAFTNNQDSRPYSERLHPHMHPHLPPPLRGGGCLNSQDDLKKTLWKRVTKKYVLLCILCGGVCILLGILFGVIFFLLRNYTSSLHYFQTLPTYIPSIMLIITGIMVLCFGRRRNRNGYLIKICGAFCLLSALVCVVVTVTTTVIHMNRLQTLRECVYQGSSRTCTCFAGILLDPTIHHDATLRYVFANAPNCEVIHGILYSCLRAMFGLSVIGILVCIFSSMLVYQLLSHEKKKKYWEQLEVRCQHLYRFSPHGLGPTNGSPHCGCCIESNSGLRSHPSSACHWPNAALDLLDERYWPLNRNGPPSSLTNPMSPSQQIATVDNMGHCPNSNNNIYTSNPSSAAGGDTFMTSLGSCNATQPETVSRSISLRSMRSWFRRLSRVDSSTNPNRALPVAPNYSHPTYFTSLHPHLHHHHHHNPRLHQQHLHQLWRLSSHSDSQYGFRVPPSTTSVSLPEPPLPQYAPPSHVLWGPPPPYSNVSSPQQQQPPAARTEESQLTSNNSSGNTNTSRTTKSGLLSGGAYDETVKSAMHIYSKTASLPSRRPKKPRASLGPCTADSSDAVLPTAKSLADITKEEDLEALSVHEVRRKLKTLGLYKVHQRSKTARELAEIRQALHDLQEGQPVEAAATYYAPSSIASTENKYETIGQSIRPYKIPEGASNEEDDSVSAHYAQISPLPLALQSGQIVSTPNSPMKSYLKEPIRSSDHKSLPIEVLRVDELHEKSILEAPISSQLLHSLNSVGARKGFHKSSSSSMEILSSSTKEPSISSSSSSSSSLLRPAPTRARLGLSTSDTKLWKNNNTSSSTSSSSSGLTPSSSASSTAKKTPPKVHQQCVYLRPEQNIPDIFGNAAFKPIPGDAKAIGSSRGDPVGGEEESSGDGIISRDDIVVAMRSVNV